MAASELRPELRLVRTEAVRFHEHAERRRTVRLMERIRAEGVLRNPPIVADMHDGHYLLLDGANRVSAFVELGYSHIPVQVVDYGERAVQLKGWHHLLLEGGTLELRAAYAALPGVAVRPAPRAQLATLLELRQVFAVLVESESAAWGLYPAAAAAEIEIHERIRVLEAVVGAYEGQSRLERVKLADYEQLPQVIQSVRHQVCLFPVLRKEELLHLAAQGVLIPTGLTRHIIPGRALGINLELAFILAGTPEAEKLAHFQAFVNGLGMQGRIRFYEESVFIMNE
jgi:L-serine kinase (ATP) / ParB family transcriptional regulator, heme-responsive regulator